jgi:predicted Zn-dependent protease
MYTVIQVLSHEIGHVISRHSQKEIIKENVLSWLVSGFLRDDRDGHRESFGENVHEMLVENAPKLSLLAFSRADEYEADSRGVALMLAAGHSPQVI